MSRKVKNEKVCLYEYYDRTNYTTHYMAYTLVQLQEIERVICRNLKEDDYRQYGAVDSYAAFMDRYLDEQELERVRRIIDTLNN